MKFIIGFISLISVTAFAKPYIEVQSHTKIHADEKITLGDIAEFQDVDSENLRKLKSIVVEDTVSEGEKKVISNRMLAQLIRREGGTYLSGAGIKIPQRVIVEGVSYDMTEEIIKEDLRKQWEPFCLNCRFAFKILSLPQIPEELRGQKWSLLKAGTLPKGNFSEKIEILDKQQRKRVFWVTGQIQILKKVPVITRSLIRGSRLLSEDVKEEFRDITYAQDATPMATAVVGKKLSKSLRAKDIIWFSSLERIKALRRGENIKIILGEDNWELTLQGVALQDGSIGDRVKVKNPVTRKTLTAIVVAESEVRVK